MTLREGRRADGPEHVQRCSAPLILRGAQTQPTGRGTAPPSERVVARAWRNWAPCAAGGSESWCGRRGKPCAGSSDSYAELPRAPQSRFWARPPKPRKQVLERDSHPRVMAASVTAANTQKRPVSSGGRGSGNTCSIRTAKGGFCHLH